MNAIVLSKDLEAWAKAEVEAGHAESVEALVGKALEQMRREQQLAGFVASLDEASAQAARGEVYTPEEVFDYIRARRAR